MSTMNDLAKRIRRSNKAYFAAGMEAGKQKVTDLFFVAAHELGMLKSPAKAKELLDKMEQLDAEYGVARNPTMQFTGWTRALRISAVRSSSRFSNGTIQSRIGGKNENCFRFVGVHAHKGA